MARLVFLGSPRPAVVCLRALLDAGHDVVLVVSQPDRRRGRGGALSPSPVKEAALAAGLTVTDRLDDVLDVDAELGVVVAYGRIVPARVLDALPMVNIHFSLLPRWRGAAPVERALLAGDPETGVAVMRLEAGLDTGPVLAEVRTPVDPHETSAELTDRLAVLGARLLVDLLAGGVEALPPGDPQVGEPTYAAKLDPAELHLDWSRPPAELLRIVRLGRAWTTFRGRRLRVLRAAPAAPAPGSAAPGTLLAPTVVAAGTGAEAGAVALLEVQPEGGRPVDAAAWGNGARPRSGEVLGADPGR